jgi:hypothetical protein
MLRSFAARQSTQAAPPPLRSPTAGNSPLNGTAAAWKFLLAARELDRSGHVQVSSAGSHNGGVREAATAPAWIPSGIRKEPPAERGRLAGSAIGYVGRDLEAKAQVNRRRSHPCHSRSPVIAASTAGPHGRVCRAVHGDATTQRAVCVVRESVTEMAQPHRTRHARARSVSRSAASRRPRLPAACPERPRFRGCARPGWRGKRHSG